MISCLGSSVECEGKSQQRSKSLTFIRDSDLEGDLAGSRHRQTTAVRKRTREGAYALANVQLDHVSSGIRSRIQYICVVGYEYARRRRIVAESNGNDEFI